MNPGETTSPLAGLIPLAIAVLIVVRFAFRELRQRTVRAPVLWLRPGFVIAVLIYLVILTFSKVPDQNVNTIVSLVVGIVCGAIVGVGIVANTSFASAGVKGAVRVQGNWITLAIWVVALLLRFAARFFYPGGPSQLAELPLNCGLIALVAAAFLVIAVAFQREITRFAPQ